MTSVETGNLERQVRECIDTCLSNISALVRRSKFRVVRDGPGDRIGRRRGRSLRARGATKPQLARGRVR